MLRFLISLNTLISVLSSDISSPLAGPQQIRIPYDEKCTETEILRHFSFRGIPLNENSGSFTILPHISFGKIGNSHHTLSLLTESTVYRIAFAVEIYDDKAPAILGPGETSFARVPSKKDFLSFYESYDEIDGFCPLKIKEDYHPTVGNNFYTLFSFDASGNFSERSVKLSIGSEKKTIWFLDDRIIQTKPEEYLTPEELTSQLIYHRFLEDRIFTRMSYIDGDYPFYFRQIGIHRVVLKLEEDSITPVEIRVRIQVTENLKNERTLSFREKVLSFIRSFVEKLITSLKKAIDLIRREPL